MELLTFALIALAGALIAWRLAAFVLGAFAWLMLVFVAVGLLASTVTGVGVPPSLVVATAALWLASQVLSRLRRGTWRSGVLRAVIPG